jgi:hypothetical protein
MHKFFLVFVGSTTLSALAWGQFDGYASGTYGFQSNPLYNYAMLSDQVKEGYWELNYAAPSSGRKFTLGYVGGLVLFNRLAERNYYEHRLTFGYALQYPVRKSIDSAEEGDNDEEKFEGNILELGGKLSARHDKEVCREFDNMGFDLSGAFTWGAGSGKEVKLVNQVSRRRYVYLAELDNVTDVLHLRVTGTVAKGIQSGYFAAVGIKHYTTSQVDTSRVETGNQGSKGQGKGLGNSAKTKLILTNSSTTNTYQISAGVALKWSWEGGGTEGEVLYRYNPTSEVRFLAQHANTTLLNEDIYNDFFSYSGLEAKLGVHQTLAFGVQLGVRTELQRKKFLAPALDLDASQTASNRIDVRGIVEGTLSREFPLKDGVALELSLTGGTSRNQSNDAYNDYSLYYFSVSAGVGF